MTAVTDDRVHAASTSCTLDAAWRRFLLTREAAIIALLLLVIVVASCHGAATSTAR